MERHFDDTRRVNYDRNTFIIQATDVDWSDDCATTEDQVYDFAAFEKKMQVQLDSVDDSALNDHTK